MGFCAKHKNPNGHKSWYITLRTLCTLFIINYSLSVSAQTMVYLERAQNLSFDQDRIEDAQILRGDVMFRHENALMYCDSAYFYERTNSLDAFGHVRFEQGDTLRGYGDVLYYDGNTKLARLRRNVSVFIVSIVQRSKWLRLSRDRCCRSLRRCRRSSKSVTTRSFANTRRWSSRRP